jgi:hypothetical protein
MEGNKNKERGLGGGVPAAAVDSSSMVTPNHLLERKKKKKSVTNEILPHMILTSRERWLRMKILNVCKKIVIFLFELSWWFWLLKLFFLSW